MEIKDLYKLYKKYPIVITDSRKVEQDCLFFALKGAQFDGNRFALDALEKGAARAIVDDPGLVEKPGCIFVEDVLKCLQDLALFHRLQFSIPIIGITGSNGKTTTKELLNAVLSTDFKTHFTKGNFNNHIGLPLTLLEMVPDTELAIIEMGANHPGEIDFLCKIARPTHGLITNVGKAHLEGFGGFEGVKKTKAELYHFLKETGGPAFVNKDEDHLVEMAKFLETVIYYGKKGVPAFELELLSADPFLKLHYKDSELSLELNTQLIGRYNFNNLLTAWAIADHFGVSPLSIKETLESFTPENNRSQVLKLDGNTFLLDAYNANPSSMEKALENFAAMAVPQKLVILGDMLELGNESICEHQKILDFASSKDFEKVVLVGEEFEKVSKGSTCLHFNSWKEAKTWLEAKKLKNAHILLKGSRGMQLEKVIE